jgi:hypothetical protein
MLRISSKQRNTSAVRVQDTGNTVELKQEAVLNPQLAGGMLQRELARLNLDVLRNMAQMLDEQEQKFSAERNTLRASGRMMRAEMRRAASETVKINSERQKLDLERDVLQSQLLARRRSARLLDLMIRDFENGSRRMVPDINRLYMYSRVLGSAQGGNDLGQQLEYETNMLDQQRFYLQSLMQPRWQHLPEGGDSAGELFPIDLTRMHPSRIPSSEIERARENMGGGAVVAWDWPRLVSPVKSGPHMEGLGLDPSTDTFQPHRVLASQQTHSEQYDVVNTP